MYNERTDRLGSVLVSSRAKSLAAGLHAQKFASGNGLIRPVQCTAAVTITIVLASFQLHLYLLYSILLMQLKSFAKHFSLIDAKKCGEEGKFPQHLPLLRITFLEPLGRRDICSESYSDKG